MDIEQRKLTKDEWDTTEIPVDFGEKRLLAFLESAYTSQQFDATSNAASSLISKLKIEPSPDMDMHLYNEFFAKTQQPVWVLDLQLCLDSSSSSSSCAHMSAEEKVRIVDTIFPTGISGGSGSGSGGSGGGGGKHRKYTISKSDLIRLANMKKEVEGDGVPKCFEQVLLDLMAQFLKARQQRTVSPQTPPTPSPEWCLFTLHNLMKCNVERLNGQVMALLTRFVQFALSLYDNDLSQFVFMAPQLLEQNAVLWQHQDLALYPHQRDLFRVCRNPRFEYNAVKYQMMRAGFDDETVRGESAAAPAAAPAAAAGDKTSCPKLIFYVAPTATGKTLTPIMLCTQFRIIFVCAARHVGLALARAAISMGKKIAFAFGCDTAGDIRLHYAAAVEYTKDKRSGGIRKVDNSVGDKVELIICDIKSYLCAMFYMMAFNPVDNLLTYWDEPTITMDYPDHPLHATLRRNWCENLVPNMILSSATLPQMEELEPMMISHHARFPETEFVTVQSFDSKKSIPIVNPGGQVEMPHFLSADPAEVLAVVTHCETNPTLLRYVDLSECIFFLRTLHDLRGERFLGSAFATLDEINMTAIKKHYLRQLGELVTNSDEDLWACVHDALLQRRQSFYARFQMQTGGGSGSSTTKQPPGIMLTSKDAHTLTDGPTLYLAENVDTIAQFCLAQNNIPAAVMDDMLDRISHNNEIREVMEELQKEIESIEVAKTGKSGAAEEDAGKKGKGKSARKQTMSREFDEEKETRGNLIDKHNKLELLQSRMKRVELNDHFVPNRPSHLKLWRGAADGGTGGMRSFTSDIDEATAVEIMSLGTSVENKWKILLLMGVGVFGRQSAGSTMDAKYTEIMKRLAQDQKLFLIIATGDYIYGTNYQFCHGYIGKDLALTQQKLLQALGRVGRHNIQQQYSVRLRNESHARLLFVPPETHVEADVMNRLFG